MEFRAIEKLAKELGFDKIGMCSAADFSAQQSAVSSQPALKERRQLRFTPHQEYPWAKAILVLLWPYTQASIPRDDEHVFVDSYYYASNQAYQAAKTLENAIRQEGYCAQANVSFPAKTAAVRAGLGVIGDNSLLITPEYGSRVVIILLATDAFSPEKEDETCVRDCLHCGKCAQVCPTGAILSGGMAYPERCLRNFMLEGSIVPEEMREKMGMKLLGCDECQRICPMQVKRTEAEHACLFLSDFVTENDQEFKESIARFGDEIGRNTVRPQRVRAQAALLAGNRKRIQDLKILRIWSKSEFDAVREHALWACKQIEQHALGLDQTIEKR